MRVSEIEVDPNLDGILAGAQFADAYRLTPIARPSDARAAAERMFSSSPRWVEGLMSLRNLLVRPFGLKTGQRLKRDLNSVGMFPVVSQSPDRLVTGFDDKHLDFRVVVDLSAAGEVTATTLVRTHNLLGRAYLALILPFHRLIVRSTLSQIE